MIGAHRKLEMDLTPCIAYKPDNIVYFPATKMALIPWENFAPSFDFLFWLLKGLSEE